MSETRSLGRSSFRKYKRAKIKREYRPVKIFNLKEFVYRTDMIGINGLVLCVNFVVIGIKK